MPLPPLHCAIILNFVQVAQFLADMGNGEMKAEFSDLHILGAKQLQVDDGKEAVVLTVPFNKLGQFKRLHIRLVRELEKKFGGKHVVVVGKRRIVTQESRNNRKAQQKRPRSRTLTAVHDAILQDLVYPAEVLGKRTRIRVDGGRILKVILDPKAEFSAEKLQTFGTVYRSLTGKDAHFELQRAE